MMSSVKCVVWNDSCGKSGLDPRRDAGAATQSKSNYVQISSGPMWECIKVL